MTTEPLPAIEPVTDEDVMVALNLPARALEPHTRRILEQDRRRVAERRAGRVPTLGQIDRDDSYMRTYIPVAPGWEVQTKGKGSTFRICDSTTKADGDRLAVPDSPYLHDTIERMARAIHAHRLAQELEIERLRAEVAAHRKHDVLRCDALMKAEAEVAKLNAACAAKDGVIIRFLNAPLAQRDGTPVPALLLASARAALSTDAGKGWIDATGAVEAVAEACEWSNDPIRSRPTKARVMQGVPDDWAGSRVLIVRVAK